MNTKRIEYATRPGPSTTGGRGCRSPTECFESMSIRVHPWLKWLCLISSKSCRWTNRCARKSPCPARRASRTARSSSPRWRTARSRSHGALWSEDTQVMAEALQKLGFQVKVEPDPEEFCNRTITVKGLGGKIPNGGHGGKAAGIVRGQRRHGGAVSGGVGLSGQRRLSVERRAADARASAGGAVPGVARTGLSRGFGKRK